MIRRRSPRSWFARSAVVGTLAVLPGFAGAAQPEEPARIVEVQASRYEYVPDVIEAVEGERIRLVLHSADVTHGFAIEELGVDVEIPKSGEAVTVEFVAGRAGEYVFRCSHFCGPGHRRMRGRLVVAPGSSAESARPAPNRRPEPDFTLINLPTNLRLPRHAMAMRLTHRFARPLGAGDFGDLSSDLFGLDGGAQIGIELRYGLTRSTQIEAYRTSDRSLVVGGRQVLLGEGRGPVEVSVLASVEGRDNFSENLSPRIGLAVSRRVGDRATLYAVPQWLGHVRLPEEPGADDATLLLGLGGRLRLGGRTSLVAEFHPRLAGFDAERAGRRPADLWSFGVEAQVGGHTFELNFSKDLATTPAQIAHGQLGPADWFLGFNIGRKFY